MEFDEQTIQKVWEKGVVIANNDPAILRQDVCTAWIRRNEHGNRDSIYGWEIDHINPDGGDELSNLRPLQWKNNVEKSDGKLRCPVKSDGKDNKEI